MDAFYFASGSSHVHDIRGFARILHPIGVAIPELSSNALAELLSLAHLPWAIFVDTGAYSEVEFGPEGPLVVRPIDEDGWRTRLDIALQLATAYGSKAHIVAPDRIGDQEVSLERLRRWGPEVRAIRACGARILVPIQRGARAFAAFDKAAIEALGFDDFVRAMPVSKKVQMPPEELAAYLRAVRPAAVHLLGMGPSNSRYRALEVAIRQSVPSVELSCDSNAIASVVGRSNGPGGGMRALTAMKAGQTMRRMGPEAEEVPAPMHRDDAIVMTFGPRLFFQQAIRLLHERGILVNGLERVGDGLEAAGYETPQGHAIQLDLFGHIQSDHT